MREFVFILVLAAMALAPAVVAVRSGRETGGDE